MMAKRRHEIAGKLVITDLRGSCVLFVFCFERIGPKCASSVWLYRAKPNLTGSP